MAKIKESLQLFISFALILWIFPSEVSAINCYQCQSNDDLECSEKFDEDFNKLRPKSCDHVFEAQYCIKTIGMFEGEIGTKRYCSSRDYGDYCDYVRRPGDERDYRSCIFTCSSDGCNHSSTVYVSKHFWILLIFIVFFTQISFI